MSSILLKMDKNAVEYANTTESGITMYVIISTDNRMDDDNIDFHQTVGPVKQNNVSMYNVYIAIGKAGSSLTRHIANGLI